VPTTDLSSHAPWLESQRRSRRRRFAAVRRVRVQRSRRTGLAIALASLTLAAGGAVAQTSSSPNGSIAAVQEALGISADGVAGPQTREAVKQFQRNNGLAVDGIVGPQTLAALGLSGGETATDSAGQGGDPGLAAIRQCESSNNYATDTGNGFYGAYQFTQESWELVGGTGNPAHASPAEQDRRAARLMELQGPSAWPNCA
jgi:hypothetical protein